MLTQCPNCHARVTLPDEHARARVRCSECGRVFVARADELGRSPRRVARLLLGGLAGALVVLVLIALLRRSDGAASAEGGTESSPSTVNK
jgi:predicted Zn finger-like uncharacterized protein